MKVEQVLVVAFLALVAFAVWQGGVFSVTADTRDLGYSFAQLQVWWQTGYWREFYSGPWNAAAGDFTPHYLKRGFASMDEVEAAFIRLFGAATPTPAITPAPTVTPLPVITPVPIAAGFSPLGWLQALLEAIGMFVRSLFGV